MASGDNGACPGGPPFLFDFTMRTRFILIQTSHAGNVGAAARMGFDDLVLVAPRWPNVLRREETIQRASGALDVLENARIVATLDEALDGMSHLCATAMTPRDFGPPAASPRAHFEMLLKKELLALDGKGLEVKNASNIEAPAAETGVAFLFGSERFGMANEDVYRCHVALSIPTNPGFGSLNLGARRWAGLRCRMPPPPVRRPMPPRWLACSPTGSRRLPALAFSTRQRPRSSCRA